MLQIVLAIRINLAAIPQIYLTIKFIQTQHPKAIQ
jgi:hypothetical protein